MYISIALLIPFIGTVLGAAMVFLIKSKLNNKVEKLLLGFASGVMVAASVWSLLIPSLDMAKQQNLIAWLPSSLGFMLGIIFLLVLDNLIPHLHIKSNQPEGLKSKLGKSAMLVLAITLHNIPEGMAVGVAVAAAINSDNLITMSSAIALSLGIAIQNFPEGAIISMPLKAVGNSRKKAFFYGTLSGIVEPIAALLTIFLTALIIPLLPYILSFAAGAMIYVVVEELIPESQYGKHSNLGTLGFAFGFLTMMILDTSLS